MVTGIIMAAGFSSRMKKDKLLMKIEGKEIIRYVIEAAKQSNLEGLILVYRKNKIRDIGIDYAIKTVHNSKAHLGQSQSIIRGVKGAKSEAYMFLAGDQPFITYKVINKLIDEYRKDRKKIIIPTYNNRISLPTIFPQSFRADLLQIKGDRGGRKIIRDNPELSSFVSIENGSLLVDIDTMEDYREQAGENI